MINTFSPLIKKLRGLKLNELIALRELIDRIIEEKNGDLNV